MVTSVCVSKRNTAPRSATARIDPKLSRMQSFRGRIAAGGLRTTESSSTVRRTVAESLLLLLLLRAAAAAAAATLRMRRLRSLPDVSANVTRSLGSMFVSRKISDCVRYSVSMSPFSVLTLVTLNASSLLFDGDRYDSDNGDDCDDDDDEDNDKVDDE
jgi:hypothetical protein